jgi:hypothetical protein
MSDKNFDRNMCKGLLLDVNVEHNLRLELVLREPIYLPTYGPTETKTIEVTDEHGMVHCVTVHFDEELFPCALSNLPIRQELVEDAGKGHCDSGSELRSQSTHQTRGLQRHLVQRRQAAQCANLFRGRALRP